MTRPPCAVGAAERGPEVRAAAEPGVRGAHRRGVAAEHRPGVHDAAAPRAGRARRVRRRRATTVRRRASGSPPPGSDELREWLRTPPDTSAPPRDELVIKVLVALRVPGVDVVELVQAHRRHLVETMHYYTRLKEDAGEHDVGLLLVADAELYRLDGVIRWLDAADARIKRLPADQRSARASSVAQAASQGRGDGDDGSARAAAGVEVLRRGTRRSSRRCATSTLAVHAGELVAIMGPSGSGKSTLLTIAGTLEEATTGDVFVDGQDVSTMSRNDRARLRRRSIGYVFQDFNLLAGLTAAENVSLPLELDGTRARAARVVAMAALEELGLADRAGHYPDELSGGERQRVAIARAVVGDRRLLLADEPTGRVGLGQRRGCHAPGARRLQARRRRGRRDPRRPVGVVGRPGRVPARRSGGRPDRHGAGSRVAPRAGSPRRMSGCGAGRAPSVRWAWRLFRREWRQQILVLTLLTVAVAAAIGSRRGGVQPRAGRRVTPSSGRPTPSSGSTSPIRRTLQTKLDGGRGMVRRDRRDRPPIGAGPGLDRDGRLPGPGPGGPVRRADARPARRPLPGGRRRGRRHRPGGRDVRPRHRRHVRPRRRGAHRRRPRREPERPRRRVRAPGPVPRRVVGLRDDVRRRVPGACQVVPAARRHGPHHLLERGPRRGRGRRRERARRLRGRVVPRRAGRRRQLRRASPSAACVSWACSPPSGRPRGTCVS